MMMQKKMREAGVLIAAVLVSACGGGGGGDSGPDPATDPILGTVLYALTQSEPELDLSDPDVALAGALAALSAGLALTGSDFTGFNFLDGTDTFDCEAGSLSQTGGETANSDFVLEASQCFLSNTDADVVLDGRVGVTTGIDGGRGVTLGSGSDSFVGALRKIGEVNFGFEQFRGFISFETAADGSDSSSTLTGQIVFGKPAPLGSSGDPFVPQSFLEVYAGNDSAPLLIQTAVDPVNPNELDVAGPVAVRGVGLDTGCNVRGAFIVRTDNPVSVVEIDGEDQAVDGLLTLTTATETATVEATSTGGAVVTTSTGTFNYTLAEVDSHCGLGG